MATRFKLAPEVLAYMLDLPEGAELGTINRVPVGNGQHVYEVTVTVPGWPDGNAELHYQKNEDLTVSLVGIESIE